MGIEFSHCHVHWAYSGFMRFRERIYAVMGTNYRSQLMEGDTLYVEDEDPIVPFLLHSDCDGELTPDECRSIGPRLLEIITPWVDDADKKKGLLLVEGMKLAADSNEPLQFL